MDVIIAATSTTSTTPPAEAEARARAAQVRLRQYGERTSTWSTATYDNGTELALHGIAVDLSAEVDRLRALTDTEYECPLCNVWARWTHGKRVNNGGQGSEFWCQSCGAVVFLAVCDSRPGVAVLQAEVDRLKAENTKLQDRLNKAAMTKVWKNEDGKKFVFVEDIAPALLGIEGSDR